MKDTYDIYIQIFTPYIKDFEILNSKYTVQIMQHDERKKKLNKKNFLFDKSQKNHIQR